MLYKVIVVPYCEREATLISTYSFCTDDDLFESKSDIYHLLIGDNLLQEHHMTACFTKYSYVSERYSHSRKVIRNQNISSTCY